jgi:2-isopropylmalate synthase
MSDRILIFDTTLRDGEQSPGATMTTPEKLEVARHLTRLGVDIIEAGYPAASPGDTEAVQMIAREVKGVVVAGLARVHLGDIDAAWEGVKGAENPRIHTFVNASPIQMQYQLRKSPDEVLEMARAAVRRCKSYLSDVQFSAMDATRADWDFLARLFSIAIEEGATTLNVPDTVGYTTPDEYIALLEYLKEHTVGIEKAIISVHCHDDLGMATANTLAAIRAGARQVEVTVNGLGERAGNTALEEVVMALHTRRDYFGDFDLRIQTPEIVPTSRVVSRASNIPVQPNKAIVGANAFAHESGIHQDGVIKHAANYEIMTPESVGWGQTRLVMGKHSGRAGFRQRLQELGYEVEGDDLMTVYQRFIALTDRKKHVSDADIIAIVEDNLQQSASGAVPYVLMAWRASSGSDGDADAAVILSASGIKREATGSGNGQIDALYSAIDSIVGIDATLEQYHIDAVTPGDDAQGAVSVRIRVEGQVFSGQGVATDIVESSIRAYLTALNRAAVAVAAPLKTEGAV